MIVCSLGISPVPHQLISLRDSNDGLYTIIFINILDYSFLSIALYHIYLKAEAFVKVYFTTWNCLSLFNIVLRQVIDF